METGTYEDIVFAIRSSTESERSVRLKPLVKINMLSTPMASTRNGITSEMIRVAGTPHKLFRPAEITIAKTTMATPASPSTNFVRTKNPLLKGHISPRARLTYINMNP